MINGHEAYTVNRPLRSYLWWSNNNFDCWWCIHNKSLFSVPSCSSFRCFCTLSMWLIDDFLWMFFFIIFRLFRAAAAMKNVTSERIFYLCLSTQLSIRLVYTQSVLSKTTKKNRNQILPLVVCKTISCFPFFLVLRSSSLCWINHWTVVKISEADYKSVLLLSRWLLAQYVENYLFPKENQFFIII